MVIHWSPLEIARAATHESKNQREGILLFCYKLYFRVAKRPYWMGESSVVESNSSCQSEGMTESHP